jgi:hypothetical protein
MIPVKIFSILLFMVQALAHRHHAGHHANHKRTLTPDNTCGGTIGYTCDPSFPNGGPCCSLHGYCGKYSKHNGNSRLTFNRQDGRLLWSWMSTSIWDMRRSRRSTCTILLTSNVGPFADFISSARNFYCPLNIYSTCNRSLDSCYATFRRRQLSTALPSWLCLGSGRCRKLHSSADF